jgi:hypothetical protein
MPLLERKALLFPAFGAAKGLERFADFFLSLHKKKRHAILPKNESNSSQPHPEKPIQGTFRGHSGEGGKGNIHLAECTQGAGSTAPKLCR